MLPNLKKNRENDTFYKNKSSEIIFWNGIEILCRHKKRKTRCIDCGGSGICQHGNFKSLCLEYIPSGFCGHVKRNSLCTDCGAGEFANIVNERNNV